jgi:hypothetical protein
MEAVRTSETSVYYNETTRHNIPERYHLQMYINVDLTNIIAALL